MAAMTAASGCAGPAPGTVPAPTFACPDRPDASEEKKPGSLLLVFVLFKKISPTDAKDARWTEGPRGGGSGRGRTTDLVGPGLRSRI